MKLKKDGKIQSIGCSNFSPQQLKRACLVSKVEYIQMPINILNGALDNSISEICAINKIKVIGYNILLNGLLTGKFNKNSIFLKNDRRSRLPLFKGIDFINALESVEKLKLKAAENNSSLTNYAINWVLAQKNISSVVVGIKNSEQIIENYSTISN